MTTVLELITDAVQDLGAIGIEEQLPAAEAAKCVRALNGMLDTWNTESLMIYNIEQETFSYVPGQGTYTIGTGGNFNTERPVRIVAAYNRNNQTIDLPIEVTTNWQDYATIIAKAIQTPLPIVMYDDGNAPLKNLTFWPVPSAETYSLVLWMWRPLSNITSLSTTLQLPPGYTRALQKNLSIEVAPAYGREPSALLQQQAIDSKAQLKRINTNVLTMRFPTALSRNGSTYSYADFLAGN